MTRAPRIINCPTCQTPVIWSEANPARPFCSERCRLIDFGDWANERHAIPGATILPEDDADPEAEASPLD